MRWTPRSCDGDAALAVHVRPARAVDLHPLVHEGGVLRAAGGPKRSVAVLLALGIPISSRGCFSPEPSEPGPGPRHFGIG